MNAMDPNTPNAAPMPPLEPAPAPPYVAPLAPYATPPAPASYMPAYQRKSPVFAGLLSAIMPGLGHLYLGAFQRALTVFGGMMLAIILTVISHSGLFGFAIAFAWFFGIVDAVRVAAAINLGAPVDLGPGFIARKSLGADTASLTWGVILTGLGLLFLVDKYTNWDIEYAIEKGWPIAFVLLGVVLIASHVVRKRKENESGVGMPPRTQG
jgi:TM2 domain-containing membrane protein YozV